MILPLLAVAMMQTKPSSIYMKSGEEVMQLCRNIAAMDNGKEIDQFDTGTCIGYVIGVVDGAELATKSSPSQFPACIPTAATRKEIVLVVLKYGEMHPERLHWVGGYFVIRALSEAYPCKAN